MATGAQQKDETPKVAKVRSTSQPTRVFFEGNDDDAFAYVEQNYPRSHSEETGADVEVTSSDGKKHQFVNGEWQDVKESK